MLLYAVSLHHRIESLCGNQRFSCLSPLWRSYLFTCLNDLLGICGRCFNRDLQIRSNLQLLLKAGFIRRRLQSDGTMVLSETSQQASDTQSLIAASDQASMALLSVANSMSTNASYIYRTTTLGMATMKGLSCRRCYSEYILSTFCV